MREEHSGDGDRSTTRRAYLRYGGAVVGGGLLAGCTGDTGSGSTTTDAAETADTATEPTATTETTADDGYSVSIEPVGEVTFESVPETWVANNGSWADMGIALGLDAPMGVWLPGRYHTQYYDEIPGVSVDIDSIRQLWGEGGVGKEQFYELDADVHVVDPNFLLNRGTWQQADVDEIAENVGPFFGNSIFSRSYPWHEGYRYYTLYEGFEKLAAVFQRTDRYEAFATLHEEFQTDLASVVPAEGERPSAAVVWGGGDSPEQYYPYVIDEGTSFKHLNDLQVGDALAATDVKNFFESRGAIDFETLLEVDPEVLLVRGQEMKTESEFQDTVVSFMENHSVASDLTAVENGDVYRAGPLYQGPITNLVITERLARTLYGVEEELFDRERVADIVAGEV
ncbi:iron complex transport system substrate-binding protein [Halogranum gelatinilyticum]|uniref:Iron complex transport system substrate-binding protein n=1 Tax=Halogranum gelatinilyticum TaxID=660521 RepID=A0A1G9X3Y1_9EURY|nr:ABC transporter substrate-binding protein [Halogranum gelatinilyticum]SDM91469.1 iron complex transport system substrate-binding protein [Halogranum gelatinilyticum]